MEQLRNAVRAVTRKMFGGKLPSSQNQGTAFGVALTWELRPQAESNLLFYGKPRKDEAKELIADYGIAYVNKEVGVDFAVARQDSPTKMVPLVGCESEMHSKHGVGYSLDDENGYTFDFWKVLMFQAPLLVFAARVNTARLGDLERSLRLCAQDYRNYWSERRLYVVLLPSASRRLDEVRVAVGKPDGDLVFKRLDGAGAIRAAAP
jgi:hypothetical protein